MFLAGSSVPISSNMGQPYAHVIAPNSKQPAVDFPPVNQPITPPHCSRLSSPLSISSHNGAQSRSGSTSTGELIARTKGVATTSASRPELATITSSLGSVSAMALIQSGMTFYKLDHLFLVSQLDYIMCILIYSFSNSCTSGS